MNIEEFIKNPVKHWTIPVDCDTMNTVRIMHHYIIMMYKKEYLK